MSLPSLLLNSSAVAASNPTTGVMLCAISLAASTSTSSIINPTQSPTSLAIKLPNIPKVSLPKVSLPKVGVPNLPDINLDLPNFGRNKNSTTTTTTTTTPKSTPTSSTVVRPVGGKVKIRASSAVVPNNPNAPSASDLAAPEANTIKQNTQGWKRFPSRRMPGANMDSFKDMAKGMKIGSGME